MLTGVYQQMAFTTTATPHKLFDSHCSSSSVFIYSKMCKYKIPFATLRNALQPFSNGDIYEYRRYRHAENPSLPLFFWRIQIHIIQYNKETILKENEKAKNTVIIQSAVVQLC